MKRTHPYIYLNGLCNITPAELAMTISLIDLELSESRNGFNMNCKKDRLIKKIKVIGAFLPKNWRNGGFETFETKAYNNEILIKFDPEYRCPRDVYKFIRCHGYKHLKDIFNNEKISIT